MHYLKKDMLTASQKFTQSHFLGGPRVYRDVVRGIVTRQSLIERTRESTFFYSPRNNGPVAEKQHNFASLEQIIEAGGYIESFGAYAGDHIDTSYHKDFLLNSFLEDFDNARLNFISILKQIVRVHQAHGGSCKLRPIRAFYSPNTDHENIVKQHRDHFSQFIIMCFGTGTKTFTVTPLAEGPTFGVKKKRVAGLEPCDVTLRDGDVLYLPAGFVHKVRTCGEVCTLNYGFPVTRYVPGSMPPDDAGFASAPEDWQTFWTNFNVGTNCSLPFHLN